MSKSPPEQTSDLAENGELPQVWVPIGTPEITSRLSAAARRGKFAGFRQGNRGAVFSVRDFGGPFESVLRATARGSAPDDGTTLGFTLTLRTGLAWMYLTLLVVTVWPGVWLTDSMLRTYFTGYNFQTWMWYIPLTAPFVPWAMMLAIRRSRARGRIAAEPIIDSIAAILGGRVIRGAESPSPAPGSGGDAAAERVPATSSAADR